METRKAREKVLYLGQGDSGGVFVAVKWDGKRLSLHGVEGPKPNGDCRGGCGQIELNPDKIRPAAGWDAALIRKLADTWDRWHLNDMRPGCEHQRQIDTMERVEVVSYGLTTEAYNLRVDATRRAAQATARGESITLTETEKALIGLDDWYKARFSPPDADSPLSGCYEVKKREQRAIGWATQAEHPRGMLSRPCEVCGYKYGSRWLTEDVPAEVIEFLFSLPPAELTPAWI